ncbi:hypothetical protein GCM10009854_12380 [Saccharopolyspora halophila]|uniref:Uncharacterized protein n=2 Tax=Saccharopolyspora halophila TaxID=405551 RepID=A0ABN3FUG1_9PSEU
MVRDDGDLVLLSAAGGMRTASNALLDDLGDPIVDDAEPEIVSVFDGSAEHAGGLHLAPPEGADLGEGMDGRADVLPYTDARSGLPERHPFAVRDGELIFTVDDGELISAYDGENDSLTTISSPRGRIVRLAATEEGIVFAGAGDVGAFTHVLPNSRNAHLGRIERAVAVSCPGRTIPARNRGSRAARRCAASGRRRSR